MVNYSAFQLWFFLTKLLKDKLIMLMLWRNLYGAVGRWSLNHRHNPDQMTLNTHRVTFLNMFNKFVNIVGETFGDKTVNNRMWNLQSLYSRSRKNCFEVKTTEYWLNRQEFALPRATPLLTPPSIPLAICPSPRVHLKMIQILKTTNIKPTRW